MSMSTDAVTDRTRLTCLVGLMIARATSISKPDMDRRTLIPLRMWVAFVAVSTSDGAYFYLNPNVGPLSVGIGA